MEKVKDYYSFLNESFKVEEIHPEKWENLPVPSSLPKINLIDSEYRNDFAKKVSLIANAFGVKPEYLMMIMYKESGMRPEIVNSIGAVGLIQFTKKTLSGMINPNTDKPYTQVEVKNMDPVEQLDLVYAYLKNSSLKKASKTSDGKLKDPTDLYLAIYLPILVGKPDTYVIPDNFVKGNEGMFKNNPEHTLGKLREYMRKEVLSIPESKWTQLSPEDFISLVKKFSDFLETAPDKKRD